MGMKMILGDDDDDDDDVHDDVHDDVYYRGDLKEIILRKMVAIAERILGLRRFSWIISPS
jgi:hypothetical protein